MREAAATWTLWGTLALAVGLGAAPPAEAGAWADRRRALDRVHEAFELRVFYSFAGPDALPDTARVDADADGIPDCAQNVAIQLVAARRVYVEALGLRHPLESPRYRGSVQWIDVHLLAPGFAGERRGIAYDGVIDFGRPGDDPATRSICIDISNQLGPRNITPAHELFHLFQYGYTLFKNRWFTEGTARWAEHALKRGSGKAGKVPDGPAAVEALFAKTYGAAGVWNALAMASDPVGRIPLPEGVSSLRYVGADAVPVVEDDVLYGAAFMRAVLEELDYADDLVSEADQLDPQHWEEARQKDASNDPVIWDAVVRVVEGVPRAEAAGGGTSIVLIVALVLGGLLLLGALIAVLLSQRRGGSSDDAGGDQ